MIDKEGSLNEQKVENLELDWLVERCERRMTEKCSIRGNFIQESKHEREIMGTTYNQCVSKIKTCLKEKTVHLCCVQETCW